MVYSGEKKTSEYGPYLFFKLVECRLNIQAQTLIRSLEQTNYWGV
jgi:hypothetical protein